MVTSNLVSALIVFDTILFSILFFMRIYEKIRTKKDKETQTKE